MGPSLWWILLCLPQIFAQTPHTAHSNQTLSLNALLTVISTREPQVDLNGDEIPDLVRKIGANGILQSLNLDSNFDGKLDYEEIRKDGQVQITEDQNWNGKPDHWVLRTHEFTLEKADRNEDGKSDYWREERPDSDGEFADVEVSYDEDFDGEPDSKVTQRVALWNYDFTWDNEYSTKLNAVCEVEKAHSTKYIESLSALIARIDELTADTISLKRSPYGLDFIQSSDSVKGEEACGDTRFKKITDGLRTAIEEAFDCMANQGSTRANAFLCKLAVHLAEDTVIVTCPSTEKFKKPGSDKSCARGGSGHIELGPKAFTGECGSLAQVLFHEVLHTVSKPICSQHGDFLNSTYGMSHQAILGLGDIVYNCEAACFGARGKMGDLTSSEKKTYCFDRL